MNKSVYLLFTIAILLTGCSEMPVNEEKEEKEYVITFHLSGEIATSETPLTKSLSNEDLLFIQVYRGADAFACGVFDNLESMKLNLKQGNEKYRMIFSLVKNGKNLLGNQQVMYYARDMVYYNRSVNAISPGGDSDFFAIDGSASSEIMAINEFWYNSVRKYTYYDLNGQNKTVGNRSLKFRNITTSSFRRGEINNAIDSSVPVPCDDWFYGEIADYSPNGSSDELSINLVRTGFKFKYSVSGITDGEVTISIGELISGRSSFREYMSNTITTASYSSEECFYSFNDIRSAWLYPDDYSITYRIYVTWHRGIGITQNLGMADVQIKRNCLNNIKINLGSNDQSAGMNLTVEAESTIGAESVTIPVE
ncbi:MAG: hypothetical protein K6G79_08465 [Bacteroidales bacterium]|nr:hypothetical protein [Bacteroidales bacterium]